MPTQADFTKVQTFIIEPMKRHWNAEFDTETLDDFVKSLTRYSEQTLRQAMPVILEENKRRPTLAHVIEACKKVSPQSSAGAGAAMHFAWDDRADQRDKLVASYLENFKNTSTIWLGAVREGWSHHLAAYVSAVASVQAQLLNPDKSGISYDAGILGLGSIAEWRAFRKEQERLCGAGNIDVAIPTGRITEWKRSAEWLARQQQPKPLAAPAEPAEKTPLDLYVDRQLAAKTAA